MEDNLSRYLETESSEGSGNRDFAQVIMIDPSAVVRIVEPESVIKCWRMWPLCDDGKKRSFVVANEFEGNSLLAKMLGDYEPYKYFKGGILESEKDELTGQKRYIHEHRDPELFLQLIYNGDKSGNNGSWRPTREFTFNGIDRKPEAKGDFMGQIWCVVHKHTKLLRMPITGFEKLKTLIEQYGRLDEYDIYYSKEGSARNTKHNLIKAGDKNALAYFGFLTDEEKQYEKYDLKKECALSSATYALKYLSAAIERCSSVLGVNYIDQFVAQSNQEKELWGISDEEEVHNASQTVQQRPAPVNVQSPAAATPPTQASRVPMPPVQAEPIAALQTQVHSAELTPEVAVRGRLPVDNVVPAGTTINCPYCQTVVSDTIEVCTNCNNRLMEPCQKCNTMFSILSNKCPNEKCGQVYKLG